MGQNREEVTPPPIQFLSVEGEMADLIRKYDWSGTALGAFSDWPLSLRTTVGMMLHSGFPMFLWWGADLTQLYNDAYRTILGHNGRHPSALGQTAEKCWFEEIGRAHV